LRRSAKRRRDEGADAEVFLDREFRKQAAVLRHMGDAVLDDAMRRHAADGAARECQLARKRRDEPGDDAKERGLAGAVRPDHADRLAGVDRERDIRQRPERAIAGRDCPKRQHRRLSSAAGRDRLR
jgi:hypothetical protein